MKNSTVEYHNFEQNKNNYLYDIIEQRNDMFWVKDNTTLIKQNLFDKSFLSEKFKLLSSPVEKNYKFFRKDFKNTEDSYNWLLSIQEHYPEEIPLISSDQSFDINKAPFTISTNNFILNSTKKIFRKIENDNLFRNRL